MSKQPFVTTSFLPAARIWLRHSGNLSQAIILSRKFTPSFCRRFGGWQRFCHATNPIGDSRVNTSSRLLEATETTEDGNSLLKSNDWSIYEPSAETAFQSD